MQDLGSAEVGESVALQKRDEHVFGRSFWVGVGPGGGAAISGAGCPQGGLIGELGSDADDIEEALWYDDCCRSRHAVHRFFVFAEEHLGEVEAFAKVLEPVVGAHDAAVVPCVQDDDGAVAGGPFLEERVGLAQCEQLGDCVACLEPALAGAEVVARNEGVEAQGGGQVGFDGHGGFSWGVRRG